MPTAGRRPFAPAGRSRAAATALASTHRAAGYRPRPLAPTSRRRGRPSEIPSDKTRSEEHTSELQSQSNLVCRLLLEKTKTKTTHIEEYSFMSSRTSQLHSPPPA